MRVKVKVCGIADLLDAVAAVELGADALGFIFAPSPRRISPERAKRIAEALPPFVCKVGVFVDEDPEEILRVKEFCGLDLVQLHGDESPELCARLWPAVIKTFTLRNLPPSEKLSEYRARAFLIDREKGGGEPLEEIWKAAAELAERERVILAGGLGPENVGRAIEAVRPFGVDVASGVEMKPGKKDFFKLQAFFEAVRDAQGERGFLKIIPADLWHLEEISLLSREAGRSWDFRELEKMAGEGSLVLAAEREGEISGYLIAVASGEELRVIDLGASEEGRRWRAERKLLLAAASEARRRGLRRMNFEGEVAKRTRRACESLGFEPGGEAGGEIFFYLEEGDEASG